MLGRVCGRENESRCVWPRTMCGPVSCVVFFCRDKFSYKRTCPLPLPPAFTARVLNSTPAMVAAPPPPSLSQISVLSSINSSMSLPSVVGQQSLEWDDWDEDDDDEKKSWWKNSQATDRRARACHRVGPLGWA